MTSSGEAVNLERQQLPGNQDFVVGSAVMECILKALRDE